MELYFLLCPLKDITYPAQLSLKFRSNSSYENYNSTKGIFLETAPPNIPRCKVWRPNIEWSQAKPQIENCGVKTMRCLPHIPATIVSRGRRNRQQREGAESEAGLPPLSEEQTLRHALQSKGANFKLWDCHHPEPLSIKITCVFPSKLMSFYSGHNSASIMKSIQEPVW